MILYARASRHRRPQYQMSTTIERVDERMLVRKRALRPEAQAGVEALPAKAARVAGALGRQVAVKPVRLENGTAVSDFIEGANLATLFEGALISKDSERVAELCGKAVGLIDGLPTKDAEYGEDHPFIRMFGPSYGGAHRSVELSYIDFNLDNFIEKDGELYLVDCEWTFDFTVPQEFLVQRFLYSFFAKYSNLIAYLCDEQLPVMEIAEDVFIPEPVYEKYKERFVSLAATIRSDRAFQEHVNLFTGLRELKVYEEPKRHERAVIQLSLDRREAVIKALEEQVEAYRDRMARAEARIERIEGSRAWRVAKLGQTAWKKVRRVK